MDNPKRILVIQLKRAGDVIETTPVLSAIRLTWPGTKIDFLVDKPFAPLLESNPDLDCVRVYNQEAPWRTWGEIRDAAYDVILDFQSSPRSILAGLFSGAAVRAGYRVTFWGAFLNHSLKRPGAQLSVTEGKMGLLRSLVPQAGPAGERRIYLTDLEQAWAIKQMGEDSLSKRAIGLVPTHRRPSRRWPARSFADLARLLMAQGHPVWLFWGPGEKDYVMDIHRAAPKSLMIPETSLRQMAALLERCQAVVANDNGPMHTAVAVGTPTVTMYGPTDPSAWNPGGPRHRAVQASGVSCLGCNLNECPFGHECMTWLTTEQVLGQLQQVLHVPTGAGR